MKQIFGAIVVLSSLLAGSAAHALDAGWNAISCAAEQGRDLDTVFNKGSLAPRRFLFVRDAFNVVMMSVEYVPAGVRGVSPMTAKFTPVKSAAFDAQKFESRKFIIEVGPIGAADTQVILSAVDSDHTFLGRLKNCESR